MSYLAYDSVFELSEARGSARLVLLAIAKHADENGGRAWPGQERLAQLVKLSVRQVRRIIQQLVKLGELVVIQGNGRGRTSRYFIPLVEKFKQLKEPAKPPPEPPKAAVCEAPTEQKRRTSATVKADIDVLQTINELSTKERGAVAPSLGVVSFLKEKTGYKPKGGKAAVQAILRRIGVSPDWVLLTKACELWLLHGHNPLNLQGILDWYDNLKNDSEWQPYQNGRSERGAAEEAAVWETVKAHAQRADHRFDDQRITKALQSSGLWPAIKGMGHSKHEEAKLRKQFLEVYHVAN